MKLKLVLRYWCHGESRTFVYAINMKFIRIDISHELKKNNSGFRKCKTGRYIMQIIDDSTKWGTVVFEKRIRRISRGWIKEFDNFIK